MFSSGREQSAVSQPGILHQTSGKLVEPSSWPANLSHPQGLDDFFDPLIFPPAQGCKKNFFSSEDQNWNLIEGHGPKAMWTIFTWQPFSSDVTLGGGWKLKRRSAVFQVTSRLNILNLTNCYNFTSSWLINNLKDKGQKKIRGTS